MSIKLYGYWRSSAVYRVRIALNLKGLRYEIVPVSLAPGESEHRKEAYRRKNPQMLIPFLEDGKFATGQSMAILEYLDETYPQVKLLPDEQPLRSQVRAFCNMIACDIHPILNLRILSYIRDEFKADPMADWYGHWIHEGFKALEQFAGDGPFILGESVSLADAFMVPQLYNARRFGIALDDYPKLVAAVDHCNTFDAFKSAAPEAQPDAV